jgi:hypothetical protein
MGIPNPRATRVSAPPSSGFDLAALPFAPFFLAGFFLVDFFLEAFSLSMLVRKSPACRAR